MMPLRRYKVMKKCWMIGGCTKRPAEIIDFDGCLYTLCITGISGKRAVTRAPKGRVFLREKDADDYLVFYNKYKPHSRFI